MSLLKSIGSIVKKAAPVIGSVAGMAYGGPAGAAVGGRIGSAFSATAGAGRSKLVAGGVSAGMGALPPIVRAGTIAAAAGGYIARGARAIGYSAVSYCRKYPGWCSTIGGTAAVEALIRNGSLPPIKRRRRRGLTPRDLASFRRVASLIKSYGPTARRVPSSCAPRRSCKGK